MQINLYQHQYNKIDKINIYKINRYKINKYKVN